MTSSNPSTIPWTSTRGKELVTELVTERVPQWPDGPKEWQVDSWVRALDGIPQIVSAATGGGKTALFYGPIMIAQAFNENPRSGFKPFPRKPVALVVVPLIELGNNHVSELAELSIRAIALNSEEVLKARTEGRNLFTEIRQGDWPVVFLSPERLTSPEVDVILRDDEFRRRIILLGLDEVHVLVPWGKDFRPAFHQMARMRNRLPSEVALVATSATIAVGKSFDSLCRMLSLKPGTFYRLQLSNERPNVRSVFQELTHSLQGYQFPDIAWVIADGQKCVVYCKTIELGFRVAIYLWSRLEPGQLRLERIRVWNSLTSASYNAETLRLFRDNPLTTTIIATIAFGMGMNLRNIIDVVNLGLPTTTDALLQQIGRAGRDGLIAACGRTYIEASVIKTIQKACAELEDIASLQEALSDSEVEVMRRQSKGKSTKRVRSRTGKAVKNVADSDEGMDEGMRRLLLAHVEGRCLVAEKNRIYGNNLVPGGEKAVMSCQDARRPYPCSSCQPFWESPSPARCPHDYMDPPSLPPPVLKGEKVCGPVLPAPPLTKSEKKHVLHKLTVFARQRWYFKPATPYLYIPPNAFWADCSLDKVVESFHLLQSTEALNNVLSEWRYLKDDGEALFSIIQSINARLAKRHAVAKQIRSTKAAQTRSRNKASAAKLKPSHTAAQPIGPTGPPESTQAEAAPLPGSRIDHAFSPGTQVPMVYFPVMPVMPAPTSIPGYNVTAPLYQPYYPVWNMPPAYPAHRPSTPTPATSTSLPLSPSKRRLENHADDLPSPQQKRRSVVKDKTSNSTGASL